MGKSDRGEVDYSLIIRNDAFLYRVYEDIYKEFERISGISGITKAKVLEIGAGDFSCAEKYFPSVIKSDIESSSDDVLIENHDVNRLSYPNNYFDIILAKDVIHHFKNPIDNLVELSRVLKPDGLIIVSEPYWSLLGRFIFRFFHPERWDTKVLRLEIDSLDPWVSNQALLYLLNSKFNKEFTNRVPTLQIRIYGPTYGLAYALSGGVFSRTIIPSSLLLAFYKLEKILFTMTSNIFALNIIATFQKID